MHNYFVMNVSSYFEFHYHLNLVVLVFGTFVVELVGLKALVETSGCFIRQGL